MGVCCAKTSLSWRVCLPPRGSTAPKCLAESKWPSNPFLSCAAGICCAKSMRLPSSWESAPRAYAAPSQHLCKARQTCAFSSTALLSVGACECIHSWCMPRYSNAHRTISWRGQVIRGCRSEAQTNDDDDDLPGQPPGNLACCMRHCSALIPLKGSASWPRLPSMRSAWP